MSVTRAPDASRRLANRPTPAKHAPMATGSKAKAVAFLVGATLFWAGNYVVGAAAVREVSPLALTCFRWVIAAGPLLIIAQLVERPDWREVRRRWGLMAVLGGLGLAAYPL